MKHVIVIAAALALCGTAFANTSQAPQKHGVVSTIKQDAKQIGSSFTHDVRRIAKGDTYRQSQGVATGHSGSHTSAMGAPASDHGRQARMDEAYARWQKSHR